VPGQSASVGGFALGVAVVVLNAAGTPAVTFAALVHSSCANEAEAMSEAPMVATDHVSVEESELLQRI